MKPLIINLKKFSGFLSLIYLGFFFAFFFFFFWSHGMTNCGLTTDFIVSSVVVNLSSLQSGISFVEMSVAE